MKTKQILTLLLFLTGTLPGLAQQDPVERLFEKYAGKEGYTSVYISSKMFRMFSDADIYDPEFTDLMKSLKSIRILTQDDVNDPDEKEAFYNEMFRSLPHHTYEELMTVTEPGQKVTFLVREQQGRISELIMIVGGKNSENVLIDIRGDIDMKKIAGLSKIMDLRGMDKLDRLEK